MPGEPLDLWSQKGIGTEIRGEKIMKKLIFLLFISTSFMRCGFSEYWRLNTQYLENKNQVKKREALLETTNKQFKIDKNNFLNTLND
jgi:hypothetical protein